MYEIKDWKDAINGKIAELGWGGMDLMSWMGWDGLDGLDEVEWI